MGQKDEQRMAILMTDTKKGGIDGRFSMLFEKGKVYFMNMSLASSFIRMNAAAVSIIPATGAWHLKILEDGISAEWELIIPEAA